MADLAFEAANGLEGAVAFADVDGGVGDTALVDGKNAVDESFGSDGHGTGGLLVESQGLIGNGGDSAEFDLRIVEIISDLGEIVAVPGKVEEAA